MDSEGASLKVGTGWIDVEVVSEADVLLTFRGYAPVLKVKVSKSGLTKNLFIAAKSLANPLSELRKRNGDRFSGLKLRLRKTGDEQTAPYEVQEA